MRKMKSRILAAILAAGMIFTAQGMTALAGLPEWERQRPGSPQEDRERP